MKSVVLPWMNNISLKMQTVVLCALRGCDGILEDDPSKYFTRFIRKATLVNADPKTSEFMVWEGEKGPKKLDRYPVHYITHVMHACHIIGREHPDDSTSREALRIYMLIVDYFHLRTEEFGNMCDRLKDKVADDE